MTTALTKFEEQQKEMQVFKELASVAVKSGNYQMSEATILNIMLSAKDFGVSPMKAINGGFYIVNGKISMSTALMADRIRKEGHSVKVIEWTSQKCVIIGQRRDNGDSVKVEFTMEDAQLAGLLSSPTWKKYPKAMLYNRAMSMLARVLFPDVVGNCYSEDEAEEIKSGGFSTPSLEVPKEELTVEVDVPVGQVAHRLVQELDISEVDHLEEYLEYCKSSLKTPLCKAADKWVENPDKFLSCYQRWLDKNKKNFEIKIESATVE